MARQCIRLPGLRGGYWLRKLRWQKFLIQSQTNIKPEDLGPNQILQEWRENKSVPKKYI